MRSFLVPGLVLTAVLGLAACNGGSDASADAGAGTVDAAPSCKKVGGEACWVLPTEPVTVKIGDMALAANYGCAPTAAATSAAAMTVSGLVTDFQTSKPVPGAKVEASTGFDFTTPAVTATADAMGAITLMLPAGTPNVMHWRTTHMTALDTYALYEPLDVTKTAITDFERGSVSITTANALPAFIGVTRTPGLGVLAGAAHDCDAKTVANAIATVSSISSAGNAAPTFVAGPSVFYFSAGGTELPVNRTIQEDTNTNGLFVVIEMPPTTGDARYFVQVWGFLSAADVTKGMAGLTLLSEAPSPVFGDAVISLDMRPTEGPL